MNVYAPIILCFVPFVTMFALFAILVPGISVAKQFIASLAGLLALVPITVAQFLIPGMRLFGQSKALSILLYSIVFLGLKTGVILCFPKSMPAQYAQVSLPQAERKISHTRYRPLFMTRIRYTQESITPT